MLIESMKYVELTSLDIYFETNNVKSPLRHGTF